MARVAIAITTLKGSKNPANPGADITWTTGDATNGHDWLLQRGDILLARNSGGVGRLVTIKAVADPTGRTEDGSRTVASGATCPFGEFEYAGWQQTTGKIHVDVAHSEVLLAVLRKSS